MRALEVVTTGNKEALLERLEWLRLRLGCCGLPPDEASQPGPEQDRVKNHCALLARNLMKVLTSRPIKGTAEGPYRVVAGLVYEAFTGEAEVDLKRACDRALVSDVT
jgi:hypothetical protein